VAELALKCFSPARPGGRDCAARRSKISRDTVNLFRARRDQWMIAHRTAGVAAFAGQDVGGLVRDPDRNQYCKVELFGHWRTAAVLAAVAAVVADYAKIKQGQGSEL
jgi:hypothetical protein